MQIPEHFDPRPYQITALRALESMVEIAVLCWARRAGKDMTSFAYSVKKMVESPMNVVLVFPTKDQGKTSFWDNIENDGWRTIDHIPGSLIAGRDNTNMRLSLKNGSTFQILGATDPDALRGANGKIYILSEFVDIPAGVMKVIRPIVAVNGGQIIIISTPKIDGISGGTFKLYFDRALKNWTKGTKTQYASLVTADEYLSPETLENLRIECIEENGNDFAWRQEYKCDFGQVSASSYFGGALTLAEKRAHIGEYPYVSAYPVFTAWDLGMSDSTAITMFQYYKKKVRIIDYFETSNIGRSAIAQYVKSLRYTFSWHFFPHDGSVRDSDAVQRIQKYREEGLINSVLVRRESKEAGIDRAVESLPHAYFNDATTTDLRRKMAMYKRKFNPVTGDYIGPEHKTESHASDSVRYLYAAIDQFFDKKTGELLISPASTADTYEMEEVNTPTQFKMV